MHAESRGSMSPTFVASGFNSHSAHTHSGECCGGLPSNPGNRRKSDARQVTGVRSGSLASEQLMTVDEAAATLAVSRRTLYRLIAAGDFPAPLRVGGARRVAASDLVEFLDRLKQGRS